jgi:hypothetical protein
MLMDSELIAWLDKRNALFRDPNIVDATKWWVSQGLPDPARPTVPLATVHKARLQWLDATDAMIAESMAWLEANGYETTMKGAPPLTPERRDADRISLGKEPLNKREADDDFNAE